MEVSTIFNQIFESNEFYKQIQKDILTEYPDAFILWMTEIKNENLVNKQNDLIKHIQDTKNITPRKELMYHGVKKDDIIMIVQHGFQKIYEFKTGYGKGTYFTKLIDYSFDYIKDITDDITYVMLCDVVIGKTTRTYDEINTDEFDNSTNSTEELLLTVTPYDYGGIPKILFAFTKK
jgi:hypothetical protein